MNQEELEVQTPVQTPPTHQRYKWEDEVEALQEKINKLDEKIKREIQEARRSRETVPTPRLQDDLYHCFEKCSQEHPEQDNVTLHNLRSIQQVLRTNSLTSDQELEENMKLSELLTNHWELEAIGLAETTPRTSGNKEPPPDKWTPAQRAIDDKMKVIFLPDEGKYQMSIPWKDGEKPNFRNNRTPVRLRQEGQLKKLPAEQREKVDNIFNGYLEKSYIRHLENFEVQDQDSRYLPYFCVCDEHKETTPVRIVWDCRAVYHGKSLNSEIEDTPNRLQDLFRVLL